MELRSLLWGLGLVLLGSCAPVQPPPQSPARPPRPPVPPPPPVRVTEVRAVWVSDTAKFDWERATSALQRAGFNTLYVNLVSGGAAFYPKSAVLPSLVTGHDEIARGIQLAHSRGLAVHAKAVVTFMFRAPTGFRDQMIKANRVMRGPEGQPVLQSGHAWLCPSQTANLELMTAAVREMLTRYPVDGLQLDYIRFCEQPSCFCASCRRGFEQSRGKPVKRWPADALDGPATTEFRAWKEAVIHSWMRTLAAEARRLRPGTIISADVFPDLQRAREEKAQDWKTWIDRRDVDYVCTMTYTPEHREFENRVRQQLALVPRQRVVVGIGSWKLPREADFTTQINIVRRAGAAGFALFSMDDCTARNFLPNMATGK